LDGIAIFRKFLSQIHIEGIERFSNCCPSSDFVDPAGSSNAYYKQNVPESIFS